MRTLVLGAAALSAALSLCVAQQTGRVPLGMPPVGMPCGYPHESFIFTSEEPIQVDSVPVYWKDSIVVKVPIRHYIEHYTTTVSQTCDTAKVDSSMGKKKIPKTPAGPAK